MKIILKGNPLSTQTIYRSACRGRFPVLYMTRKGKEMKELYQSEAKKQYKGKVISGDCDMEITLFFKDRRARDVDNFNKLVLDALEGIIYLDDKQIQKLTVEKKLSAENPRIELEVRSREK